jgi:hypothetical protein
MFKFQCYERSSHLKYLHVQAIEAAIGEHEIQRGYLRVIYSEDVPCLYSPASGVAVATFHSDMDMISSFFSINTQMQHIYTVHSVLMKGQSGHGTDKLNCQCVLGLNLLFICLAVLCWFL